MSDIEHRWVGGELWIRDVGGEWARWSVLWTTEGVGDGSPEDPFMVCLNGDHTFDCDNPPALLDHVAGLYEERREEDEDRAISYYLRLDEARRKQRAENWKSWDQSEEVFGEELSARGSTDATPVPPVGEPPISFRFPIKIQNGKPWISNSGSDWRIYLEVPVTSVDDPDSSWSSGPHNNSFEIEKGTAKRLVAVVGGERSEPLDLAKALQERGL